MKVSTVLIFTATIMGATAHFNHRGLDLEQRGLELEERELDLERREIKFKRMARAWLAVRDAQDGLSPRSSNCTPCPAGTYCDETMRACVPLSQPPIPDYPPPPPPPPGKGKPPGNNKKSKKGRK